MKIKPKGSFNDQKYQNLKRQCGSSSRKWYSFHYILKPFSYYPFQWQMWIENRGLSSKYLFSKINLSFLTKNDEIAVDFFLEMSLDLMKAFEQIYYIAQFLYVYLNKLFLFGWFLSDNIRKSKCFIWWLNNN